MSSPETTSISTVPVVASLPAEYHVLNLGAGVQSTTLYLLAMEGRIQRYDYAIFADTQDEPGAEERRLGLPDPPESVYAHLDWLIGLKGPPILVRTRGRISDDLLRDDHVSANHPNGVAYLENHRHRFASIPAFVAGIEGAKENMVPRQCTKEYKVEVIDKTIRYEILGLSSGDRLPAGVTVHQSIGISWDERSRAFDVARRFEIQDTDEAIQEGLFGGETVIQVNAGRRQRMNWQCHFPLLEMNGEGEAGWTRDDCEAYLRANVPHKVYGSACIMCPFQDDPTWARRMQPGPTREKLLQIDTGIRTPGVIVNRGLDQKLYLHRECRPIDQIDFANERQMGFAMECEGGCGL